MQAASLGIDGPNRNAVLSLLARLSLSEHDYRHVVATTLTNAPGSDRRDVEEGIARLLSESTSKQEFISRLPGFQQQLWQQMQREEAESVKWFQRNRERLATVITKLNGAPKHQQMIDSLSNLLVVPPNELFKYAESIKSVKGQITQYQERLKGQIGTAATAAGTGTVTATGTTTTTSTKSTGIDLNTTTSVKPVLTEEDCYLQCATLIETHHQLLAQWIVSMQQPPEPSARANIDQLRSKELVSLADKLAISRLQEDHLLSTVISQVRALVTIAVQEQSVIAGRQYAEQLATTFIVMDQWLYRESQLKHGAVSSAEQIAQHQSTSNESKRRRTDLCAQVGTMDSRRFGGVVITSVQ